jgi:hypothetical protein
MKLKDLGIEQSTVEIQSETNFAPIEAIFPPIPFSDGRNFEIFIKTLTGKTMTIRASSSD